MMDFLTDRMCDVYVKGPKLFSQAKEWHMGAEILTRQSPGYYGSNHDDYHSLAPSDPPCKGYGNWILWYVAGIIAPGFHGKVSSPASGGAFIEGVLTEWTVAPKDPSTWESQTIRLKKIPKKAQLFQELCDLLRPVTRLYGDCPRLASQLKSVSNPETLETLCAQYIQQDQRLPTYSFPSTNAPGADLQCVPQGQQCLPMQSTRT